MGFIYFVFLVLVPVWVIGLYVFPDERPKVRRGRGEGVWIRVNLGILNKILRRSHVESL